MKVVLVNPPLAQRYVHSIDEPLGLLYLAAAIRDKHEVHLIDSLNNMFSAAETADIIADLDADVVAISLVFTGAYQLSLQILELLKIKRPSIISILGGNTATFLVEKLLDHKVIDYVVRGEGDCSFPQLLDAIGAGENSPAVTGVSYRGKESIVHNRDMTPLRDLNRLSFPARNLLPEREKYPRSILSSRGCAYGCIYCSAAAFWQQSFRVRSVDNILAEIQFLRKEGELKYFSFADDCLTLLPQRAREIARKIRALRFDCTWGCTGRIETVTEGLLRDLSAAGCIGMFFGVESGSERVLRRLGRRYTPEKVYETYKLCIRYGIKPFFSFMVGLPFEQEEDLILTYRLIERLEGVENGVHILTPLPGTPIFNEPGKYGLEFSEDETEALDINSSSVAATKYLTRENINEAYRKAVGYSYKALRKTGNIRRIIKEA